MDAFEDEDWASVGESEDGDSGSDNAAPSLQSAASDVAKLEVAIAAAAKHEVEVEAAAVAVVPDTTPGSKKTAPKRMSPGQARRLQALHRVHLLGLIGALARRSQACNSPLVQAALASQLPTSVLASCAGLLTEMAATQSISNVVADQHDPAVPRVPSITAIKSVLGWFALRFRVAHPGPLPRTDPVDEGYLCDLATRQAAEQDEAAAGSSPAMLLTEPAPAQPVVLTPDEAACLFCAICRSVGVPCRLVGCLDPIAAVGGTFEPTKLPSVAQPTTSTNTSKGRSSCRASGLSPAAASRLGHIRAWVEVFATGDHASEPATAAAPGAASSAAGGFPEQGARWRSICPSRQWVGRSLDLTASRPKGSPPAYCIAVSGSGAVRDVSRRYCLRWSVAGALRRRSGTADWLPNALWSVQRAMRWRAVSVQDLMAHVCELEAAEAAENEEVADLTSDAETAPQSAAPRLTLASSTLPSVRLLERQADLEEAAELRLAERTEPLPTSLAGFRSHPLYCLESLLTSSQLLRPRGPELGRFKGEAVFPRACVRQLLPLHRWVADHGVRVRHAEQGRPARLAPRKKRLPVVGAAKGRYHPGAPGATSSSSATGAGSDAGAVALFGEWQTEPLDPPPVVSGKVPRNRFGNYDLLHPKCLPAGAVHLSMPRVAKAARAVGVSFAPAVVAFDYKGGAMVPRVVGVIVPVESEAVVRDAWATLERQREADAARQRAARVAARWESLVAGARLRVRVARLYHSVAARAGAWPQSPPQPVLSEAAAAAAASAGGVAGQVSARVGGSTDVALRAEPAAQRRSEGSGSAAMVAASLQRQQAVVAEAERARVASAVRMNAEQGVVMVSGETGFATLAATRGLASAASASNGAAAEAAIDGGVERQKRARAATAASQTPTDASSQDDGNPESQTSGPASKRAPQTLGADKTLARTAEREIHHKGAAEATAAPETFEF